MMVTREVQSLMGALPIVLGLRALKPVLADPCRLHVSVFPVSWLLVGCSQWEMDTWIGWWEEGRVRVFLLSLDLRQCL